METIFWFLGGVFAAMLFAFIPILIVDLTPLKKSLSAYLAALVVAALLAATTALGTTRPSLLDWLKVVIAIVAATWFVVNRIKQKSKPSVAADPSPVVVSNSQQKNTSPPQAIQPSAIVTNTLLSTALVNGHQQTTVDVDHVYALIAEELETGVADKGLWTRLFAECSGDEKQTKVLYIKQRAERLISTERLRLEEAARVSAAEVKKLEQLQLQSLSLRERLLDKNITSELAGQLRELSKTHSAVTIMNKVRQNQIGDVLAMLNDNPLLIAVTNSDGDTPLHIALREKYPKLVKLLLENGARVEIRNAYGITPIELASKSGQEDIARMVTSVAH